nr:MAG TPA: hypothetical protein [Bacteriophage sp.]
MDNSLNWLLSEIIEYAAKGNDIIVKTPNIVISVKIIESFVSWIVIYKKLKFNLISEIGETDTVFYSITSFINDIDMGDNDADNS